MTRTNTVQPDVPHRLISFLPAVFRASPALHAFLEAFEPALFAGHAEEDERVGAKTDLARRARPEASLEEQIGRIPTLLDPEYTDDEFLGWLSQWAAISLFREARDPRRLIASAIPLYRLRGTGEYVRQMLELFIDASAEVEEEELPGLALGVAGRARVALDTRLGEDPFRFSVRMRFNAVPHDRAERMRLLALARKVVDLAKPAYTHYHLSHNLFDGPRGFVIAVRSRVGIDTHLYPKASPVRRERPRP